MASGTRSHHGPDVLDGDFAAIEQLATVPPAVIHEKARRFRDRSRQCADLAGNCVTAEAKVVLEGMADDYRLKADKLDSSLMLIRRLYTDSFEAASPQLAEERGRP